MLAFFGYSFHGCFRGFYQGAEEVDPGEREYYQQLMTDPELVYNTASAMIALGDFNKAQGMIDHGKKMWPDDKRFTALQIP